MRKFTALLCLLLAPMTLVMLAQTTKTDRQLLTDAIALLDQVSDTSSEWTSAQRNAFRNGESAIRTARDQRPNPTTPPPTTPPPTTPPPTAPTGTGPAITQVSGSLTHGGTATISGARFGSKPTAAPIKYDDFQNLAIGQNLNANGWEVEGYHAPVAANTVLRPGTPFTKNAHSFFEQNISWTVGGDTSNFHLTGLTNTKYYMDFWHYITTDSNPQPSNIKPWRLHQVSAGSPNVYFGFAGPSASDTVFGTDGTDSNISGYFGSTDNGVSIPLSGSDWYKHWLHFQIMLDVGTPGQANGSLITYLNGKLRMNYKKNAAVLAAGYRNFPELYLGNYVRSDPHGNTHAYFDSVYVDGSWAHVEIGNNAVYANCTQREIQVANTWADGTITVALNRGAFSTLSSQYLFVVDSNGTVSPGFQLN
jgi:hypothetical protein